MLPRGVELVRLLHLKPRLGGRCNGHKILYRLYTTTVAESQCHAVRVRSYEIRALRAYSTKDSKILAAPPKTSTDFAEQKTTTKTKTTQNTATEPKKLKNIKSTTSQTSANAATTTPSTENVEHLETPPKSLLTHDAGPMPHQSTVTTKTKTLEIETRKGILSVTTTIEDSKINDIVLEKTTKSAKPKHVMPPATISVEEVNRLAEACKEAQQQTIDKANESQTALTTERPLLLVNEEEDKKKLNTLPKAAESLRDALKATASLAGSMLADDKKKPSEQLTVDAEKPKPMPRLKVDFNRSSLERNFITPSRAMSDFLLKPTDLDSLSKIKRRSPYEQEPPITVFWRKDVEAKAIEVWGSRENLLRETLKREIERKKHQQNIFTVKRRLREYRREIGSRTTCMEEPGLTGKSGKVVLIAIGINGINFLFKVCGWLYTGSHSMFSESIHSLADTVNQCILAYGIHKSVQIADSDHPYGYANMKYVSSLISGVGIFCVGAGLSIYHGITGLMHPPPMEDFFWAFFILGGSLVSEGATLLVAINELKRSAKMKGISFKEYVLSGKDPCVNVVLTEDAAAVAGVTVAATCMGLTQITGSPVFDAVGSLLVGGILGAVASFIIYTNVQALVGRSIPEDLLNKINSELEADVMIRAIHDVKGIDMGNCLVRYKAEMDFDGRELTRFYLDKQDLNELLKVVKSFQTVEELEKFLLAHGENIVDLMGGEIDRIEMKLRKKFPEIRHCDLEIL